MGYLFLDGRPFNLKWNIICYPNDDIPGLHIKKQVIEHMSELGMVLAPIGVIPFCWMELYIIIHWVSEFQDDSKPVCSPISWILLFSL